MLGLRALVGQLNEQVESARRKSETEQRRARAAVAKGGWGTSGAGAEGQGPLVEAGVVEDLRRRVGELALAHNKAVGEFTERLPEEVRGRGGGFGGDALRASGEGVPRGGGSRWVDRGQRGVGRGRMRALVAAARCVAVRTTPGTAHRRWEARFLLQRPKLLAPGISLHFGSCAQGLPASGPHPETLGRFPKAGLSAHPSSPISPFPPPLFLPLPPSQFQGTGRPAMPCLRSAVCLTSHFQQPGFTLNTLTLHPRVYAYPSPTLYLPSHS